MAILLLGKSESSCSVCSSPAWPTEDGHYRTRGVRQVNGKWESYEKPACGQRWEEIQSNFYYPTDFWADYIRNPDSRGAFYSSLLGLPCYDASGKYVGRYGEGMDIQLGLW